jgi:hypothetical protein
MNNLRINVIRRHWRLDTSTAHRERQTLRRSDAASLRWNDGSPHPGLVTLNLWSWRSFGAADILGREGSKAFSPLDERRS